MLASDVGTFFQLLWPEPLPVEAGLSICSRSRDRGFHYRRRVPLKGADRFVREVAHWADQKEDVYTGVAAVRPDAPNRGKVEHVAALPAIWAEVDFDDGLGAHREATGVPSLEAAVEFVHSCGLTPSFYVASGHGIHVYWSLREPWVLGDPAEREKAVSLYKRFGETLRAAGEQRGYRLDPVFDLARVLRVPGTMNHKTDTVVPVVLHAEEATSAGQRVYEPIDFERWIRASAPKLYSLVPKGNTIPVVEAPSFKRHEAGESLAASAEWPARLGPFIKRLKTVAGGGGKSKPGSSILAQKMLAREPLANVGSRDTATNAAAGVLAFASKYMDLTVDDLFPVLWGSVENMPGGLDDPPPTQHDAYTKLKRAVEAAKKDEAKEKAENAAFEEALVRSGRERRKQERAGIANLEEYRAKREAEDDSGYYTPEDIERFARDNDCTVREWDKRWVIAVNNRYFIWTEDRYVSWPAQHIAVTCAEQLAPAGLELYKRNKRGEITGVIGIDEIIRRHGRTARAIEIDLAAKKTTYDAVRQIIIEAPCPLRPIEPVYHKRIDDWMRALGGPLQEKLLDWVATVTELDMPSSALYLDGCASGGKSMLALGLARLWGQTPASFSQVFGSNFNSDLARCPFVFADEALPETRDKDITAVLRDAVSQEERTLNRKHQDEMVLRGAVRILIAGNNPDLIAKSAKGLSGSDLHAYVTRFLHIKVGPEAPAMLASWGGRAVTGDWVTGNKIAEHAKWLAKNRKVKMGARFRVDGVETSMHRSIVAKGAQKTLEWLALYISGKAKSEDQVLIGGEGLLLVSTAGVNARWTDVNAIDTPSPGMKGIGAAVKSISFPEALPVKRNGKETRYRVVQVSYLYDLMREVDGSESDVQARLAQPLPEWLREDLLARTKVEKHPWLEAWRLRGSP